MIVDGGDQRRMDFLAPQASSMIIGVRLDLLLLPTDFLALTPKSQKTCGFRNGREFSSNTGLKIAVKQQNGCGSPLGAGLAER